MNDKIQQLESEKLPAYNIHPGEDLQDELVARELNQKQFAELIGMKPNILNEIIKAKRKITPQIALRLEAGLGISAEFWLKGQQMHDLYKARQTNQDMFANIKERIEKYHKKT